MYNIIMEILFKSTEILISFLTLILTPIFSALVVHCQLKKSHFYWKKQQNFINKLELNRLKISTYRETVELVNELNNAILNHHIYASNRDLNWALSILLKDISPKDAEFFSEQFDVQKVNAENSYLNMRQLSIKVSGLGVNLKVYFDKELFDLFLELHNKFKLAQNPIISKEEVVLKLKQLIEKNGNWIDAKRIFTEEYDDLMEGKRPINETNVFLTEIMNRFEYK
jgi:hypothetical protein